MRAFAFVLLVAAARAEAEADAYTVGQVAHGYTAGGVVTGVDYGHGVVSGVGAIGNRAYAGVPVVGAVSHVAPVAAVRSVATPLVRSVYGGVYNGVYNNLYNGHYYGKREAEAEPEADADALLRHWMFPLLKRNPWMPVCGLD